MSKSEQSDQDRERKEKLGIIAVNRPRMNRALPITGTALLLGYISGYFWVSEIHQGLFQGTPIKHRLFHRGWEERFWAPLLQFEKWVRQDEFYGHVPNGASLPPGDPAFYPEPPLKVVNPLDATPTTIVAVYTVRPGHLAIWLLQTGSGRNRSELGRS